MEESGVKELVQVDKPIAKWECYKRDREYGVVISLGSDKNFISASLSYDESGLGLVYVDMFQVSQPAKGLGTRLLKSLVSESTVYGAKYLMGHVTSESALKTRARVFGKENLLFFDHESKKPLSLSYDEVLDSGIKPDVLVDLTKIDSSDWERPIRNTQE